MSVKSVNGYLYIFRRDGKGLLEYPAEIEFKQFLNVGEVSAAAFYVNNDGKKAWCHVLPEEGLVLNNRVWFSERKSIAEAAGVFIEVFDKGVQTARENLRKAERKAESSREIRANALDIKDAETDMADDASIGEMW